VPSWQVIGLTELFYIYLNNEHLKPETLGIHISFGARDTDGNFFCNYSFMSLLQSILRQYQKRDKGVHVRELLPEPALVPHA